MDEVTTVGIDLAKEVFAICVLDARGALVERKVLRRAAFERWAESLCGPCTVAMEACGSAHHWGRFFAARGHSVRLMAAEFVVPFARLAACDAQIQVHARHSPQAERIRALLGVGPITASAVVATVPDAKLFRHGRLFGAWLGLTPRQHSTGGKTRLGSSSKRGDAYLRGLLVNGARSALQAALRAAPDKATRLQQWMVALARRCGYQKALVAIANKHARMIWAMLARDEGYDPEAWKRHARAATPMPAAAAPGAA